ncbi:MraY family glycosyltransferase [Pelotalea chapellei]|uniref:Undecaprenyl/decaprenyl-phosphate alpha-N-acetylglucosaminyl 1-phosphate transferase n=1 Tax=Pelotalea chapellei TaxID=44671 RepID=A0ABS5U5P0_9BACT|nr:MraY family glycosyltransferase [Pelotalea chapellei]MBT1070976.1 undecaprenyl/decaprenyl-phosphate alpha-N-acetylglucosaminyl 1-phosphate transferase [Pelotalea chapellei]
MPTIKLCHVLLTSLSISLLVLPHIYSLAEKIGGVDLPDNHRKVHKSATPRLGGIAIVAAMMISLTFFCSTRPLYQGFLAGSVIIFLIGFIDDMKQLTSRQKLVGQIMGVTTGVVLGNNYLTSLGDLLGLGEITFPPIVGIPLTVICIVGVVNAINMIDGLDGLAGGIAAIASIAFALLAFSSGNTQVLKISVALLGAVLGFLTHNSYPARLFMGDAGSNLIGFTLGMLAVALPSTDKISPVAPLIILAVPILDTLYVMISRMHKQKGIMSADRAHLHHRLLDLGLSHKSTVRVIHVCSAFMAAIAVIAYNASDYSLMAFIFFGTILFYGGLYMVTRYFSLRATVIAEECPEPSLSTRN